MSRPEASEPIRPAKPAKAFESFDSGPKHLHTIKTQAGNVGLVFGAAGEEVPSECKKLMPALTGLTELRNAHVCAHTQSSLREYERYAVSMFNIN